jgi:hypothetical protein
VFGGAGRGVCFFTLGVSVFSVSGIEQDPHDATQHMRGPFVPATTASRTNRGEGVVWRAPCDRNKSYQSIIFWHRLNKVQNVFREHHVFLLKNSIFMTAGMKRKFTEIGDLAWGALMEHKINHEMGVRNKRPQLEKFEKQGDAMLSALETEIQKRLWSDASL